MDPRQYTSRRYSILTALSNLLKTIDGTGSFGTNLWSNVFPKAAFFDEIDSFPAVYMTLGNETRQYQGGGYKDRFLTVIIRCYVKDDNDSQRATELLLEDIETVIEENGRLAYQDSTGATQFTQDILISSINTDEGVLSPEGIGEMLILVRY